MWKSQISFYGSEATYLYWKERRANKNVFMRKALMIKKWIDTTALLDIFCSKVSGKQPFFNEKGEKKGLLGGAIAIYHSEWEWENKPIQQAVGFQTEAWSHCDLETAIWEINPSQRWCISWFLLIIWNFGIEGPFFSPFIYLCYFFSLLMLLPHMCFALLIFFLVASLLLWWGHFTWMFVGTEGLE